MKYHQIEAFYQVMLTRSFSQAATNLGRTQPAISMTINSLEDFLQTKLFERQAGRVTPRAEAQVLFEQIGPVIRQLHEIRSRFSKLEAIPVPRVSIITANNPGMTMIPSVVAPLAASGQEFCIMNGMAASIVSEIENQRHDIGVTDQGPADIRTESPLLEAEVFEVPVCAVLPAGLLGSSNDRITCGELAKCNVYTSYSQHISTPELCASLPSSRVEFESLFPMACHALANGGVAIVDSITCSAIGALTRGVFQLDYRIIDNVPLARYYLLRPRYRPRSNIADRTCAAIRGALAAHSKGPVIASLMGVSR